ncbi:flagellar type III secretion system protein FliR [Agrobacterium vitis]|uniref:Flagellar biosynthetic protein FliR n=1 Tax=Agrobacterium vitis TaxID=373 RepID=A0A368NXY3_AGRVI|nr:flagellar biosynthetic protein FliR [Agrobacterium vitis]KAA3506336.1 flagellar type III secretion system protein FliR [Agrobacterium vitis]KAA3520735.1 flagellar type III secretion system protein FliR [Agrobacterium vitis]MCF1476195.1 flagellar type III secretion system protein FliR [Agrobacterium vitis]MUZ98483.1 flagellar type III secretion system protein FliR [Agrobacterium vitis]MVA31178.1 flagellar type III secretion system protein FliR [Agrobacterium vitis]
MITDPQGSVLAVFLVFCRIGSCFMTMPGFASSRIPTQIRLLVAVAVSMACTPLVWDSVYPKVSSGGSIFVALIFTETLIGAVFGLITRFFTLGLQFAGAILTMMIGFNSTATADVLEDGAENQMTNMISFCGLMMLFMMDFHHVIFRALIDSYTVMPMGGVPDTQKMLITLTDTASRTYMLMLRLSSPFIIYGLMFNLGVGLVNKLAPQIPVYYISTPYLITGGMLLVYWSIGVMMRQFADAFIPIFLGH